MSFSLEEGKKFCSVYSRYRPVYEINSLNKFYLRSGFLTRYCSIIVRNTLEANKNIIPDDCNNITMQQNIVQ
jgi:hypothetical protein